MNLNFLLPVTAIIILSACNNQTADVAKPLCDTTCLKDSLTFTIQHPQKPYVYITASDCKPDSLIWSHSALDNNRKMAFNTLVDRPVYLNKANVSCYIKDTSYAWLKFNDCLTGRGYLMKLPFNKGNDLSNYTSALNNFDPQFKIAEGLICYADYTFIYVEDMETGKAAKLLMNDEELKIDWNNIHKTFESVNVTRQKIEADILINGNKKHVEKNISL
jgi:hypothetical protein